MRSAKIPGWGNGQGQLLCTKDNKFPKGEGAKTLLLICIVARYMCTCILHGCDLHVCTCLPVYHTCDIFVDMPLCVV
jgi:hypothetical protein